MSTPGEIQSLLRFLSQDAKMPITKAMGCIKELKSADLFTIPAIAASNQETLQSIFTDPKTAKQVLNAAKRHAKKRSNPDSVSTSPAKKARTSAYEIAPAQQTESSLALPDPIPDESLIAKTVLVTNRAPVVLAFGVVLLKYTMPEQPLSSRLSLAQAAVSMNSRSKAVSLGIEQGQNAEEEGWGQGQVSVKVMGRSVRTMKRVGWRSEEQPYPPKQQEPPGSEEAAGQVQEGEEAPALWALDLEALKKSAHGVSNDGTGVGLAPNLPIYTPQSARSYLMRAFAVRKEEDTGRANSKSSSSTGKSNASRTHENVALLLGSLDLLFQSWSAHLTADELDRRAWNWYVQVRPSVEDGVRGWGAKGELKLDDILKLRRKAEDES